MKEVKCRKGKHEKWLSLVEDTDYELVKQYVWRVKVKGHTWYPVTGDGVKTRFLYMHQLIMGDAPEGYVWDHKDRNGWNNLRNNLRVATRGQNAANGRGHDNTYAGFRGVSWNGVSWGYVIMVDGITHRGFGYSTPEEAAKMRDTIAKKLLGEFAYLNFPENVTPLESKDKVA